jgi:transcriptional regulator with XRE-family HTH domain
MKLKDRLKQARNAKNWSQSTLEEHSGVKQAVISKIERGDQERTTYLTQLAKALDVTPAWLESGEEPSITRHPAATDAIDMVPIIDWDTATDWTPNLKLEGKIITALPILRADSPRCDFGLIVTGDAMRETAQHGSFILISTSATPNHGDAVLVKLAEQSTPIFRILTIIDNNTKHLTINNDKINIKNEIVLSDADRIIGVAIHVFK